MKKLQENPTAKVAVKKNVLKQYKRSNEDVVFLKNDAEFEIELYNPLSETVKADVSINGKKMDGIVLYPGERVFLERWTNSPNKFKFTTYIDSSGGSATKDVGRVKVSFYKESTVSTYNTTNIWQAPNPWYTTSKFEGPNTGGISWGYSASFDTCNMVTSNYSYVEPEGKEVGIITEGAPSSQVFASVYSDFFPHPFHIEEVRILPESQKVKTSKDLKENKYCTDCGSKAKYSHKYCSKCGNKL